MPPKSKRKHFTHHKKKNCQKCQKPFLKNHREKKCPTCSKKSSSEEILQNEDSTQPTQKVASSIPVLSPKKGKKGRKPQLERQGFVERDKIQKQKIRRNEKRIKKMKEKISNLLQEKDVMKRNAICSEIVKSKNGKHNCFELAKNVPKLRLTGTIGLRKVEEVAGVALN